MDGWREIIFKGIIFMPLPTLKGGFVFCDVCHWIREVEVCILK